MPDHAVQLSFPEPDIALLTIDVPGRSANMLGSSLLSEISSRIDEIEKQEGIAGIVLASAKPSSFIVGADLRELSALLEMSDSETIAFFAQGKELFQRFASISAVTVSIVQGACVGGGAELAAWCDRRVFSSSQRTCFGFPEVDLGLIPAWGGTVRIPRMIGLIEAIDMIAGGSLINTETSLRLGIADRVVGKEEMLSAAIKIIREQSKTQEYVIDRERLAQPITVEADQVETIQESLANVTESRTLANSPAPATVVKLMLETASREIRDAMQMESEAMSKLFGSEPNRALLNLFFLQDRVKKDSGLEETAIAPQSIDNVGIAGAGLMGRGIAHANIVSGISATLFDIDEDLLDSAKQALSAEPTASELLTVTSELGDLSQCDLCIESIVENEGIKQEFLERIETEISDDALLASNTSSISIDRLGERLNHPERFCGLHFAHPVAERKLVEIVRGEKTSDQTVASAVAYGKRIGKLPIVVSDSPGFVLNRLLFPYVNESLVLMSEGAPIREIDAAAVEYGMQYGPISHFDCVGLDTAAYTGMTMYRSFSRRAAMTPILTRLVKKKRLGIKSGRGFYSYENDSQVAEEDSTLHDFVGSYIQDPPREFSREEIRQRLFLPVLVEATMILEEKLVRHPGDIDLCLVFGLAFPKSKGGILFWADRIGPRNILEMLKPLAGLGPRFEPTELMRTMADNEMSYYG